MLWRVDQEQPAERPEGLCSEVRLVLLVEQQHRAARIKRLGRRNETREPGPDNDEVGLIVWFGCCHCAYSFGDFRLESRGAPSLVRRRPRESVRERA